MAQPAAPPPCPPFNYTKYQVADYDIPYEAHLTQQPESGVQYKYVANGAYVIQRTSALAASTTTTTTPQTSTDQTQPRILLIQRAAHDSWPHRWEIPGGACDPEDASMLDSVARELWEEAGLTASRIGPLVGGTKHMFVTRTGNLVCRFSFLVDVHRESGEGGEEAGGGGGGGLQVKLDPNEHQAFVWATEEEVAAGRAGEVELVFTNQQTRDGVLEAFRVWAELGRNSSTV